MITARHVTASDYRIALDFAVRIKYGSGRAARVQSRDCDLTELVCAQFLAMTFGLILLSRRKIRQLAVFCAAHLVFCRRVNVDPTVRNAFLRFI